MEKLLLLLVALLPLGSGQNSSLKINTHLKDIADGPVVLASIQGPGNICIREEPYVEHVQVPEMQPVRVRTSSWCMEIPPRCATYKTEMREVMRVQKLNKTRTVRFCCQGYEGNLSDSQATCKPICRGGCGRGSCVMPDTCSCEEGYIGKHCTQRCDHDRWGLDCKNVCECQNGAACDNKSGICHCLAGWTGQFCEKPCPQGTHGIMCRKACDCDDKPCHPQTGACSVIQDHPLELNVSHVIVETVNSTLEKMGIIPRPVPSSPPLPEVIVIKQPGGQESGQHTPKIIVHQSGSELLENLHSAAAAGVPAPEVIHVITNGITSPQEHLAGFVGGDTNTSQAPADHQSGLVTMLVIIMLLLLISIAGSLYMYRRHHLKEASVYNANGSVTNLPPNPEVVLTGAAALGKNFHEPLPEPPVVFTVTPQSNEVPTELYDTPSNNSSIKTPPYAYARKESLYSVVSPKSRKGSLDSHLYDEIRYHQQQHHHTHPHSQSHHHQQPRGHQNVQHSTTASAFLPARPPSMPRSDQFINGNHHPHQRPHHVTHLIIPPQNSNFLQVPAQITAKRIAHL